MKQTWKQRVFPAYRVVLTTGQILYIRAKTKHEAIERLNSQGLGYTKLSKSWVNRKDKPATIGL